jgi:hypothetical protein
MKCSGGCNGVTERSIRFDNRDNLLSLLAHYRTPVGPE